MQYLHFIYIRINLISTILSVNKFGSENRPDNRRISSGREGLGGPTKAIVTLNVAIEGNMVGKPLKISSRQELMTLLSSIGSDVQLEDNELLSAEILWSPEDPSDELLQDEIYSQYPELLLI